MELIKYMRGLKRKGLIRPRLYNLHLKVWIFKKKLWNQPIFLFRFWNQNHLNRFSNWVHDGMHGKMPKLHTIGFFLSNLKIALYHHLSLLHHLRKTLNPHDQILNLRKNHHKDNMAATAIDSVGHRAALSCLMVAVGVSTLIFLHKKFKSKKTIIYTPLPNS